MNLRSLSLDIDKSIYVLIVLCATHVLLYIIYIRIYRISYNRFLVLYLHSILGIQSFYTQILDAFRYTINSSKN